MDLNIAFYSEEIDFSLSNEKSIIEWIVKTIRHENRSYKKINFIFCSDDYLLKINNDYLQHNYYTDIITFPYHDQSLPDTIIEGDIFISIPRIEENSRKYFVNFANELNRVIIHGILHLIGYLDATDEQKAMMTEKEDYYLSKLS